MRRLRYPIARFWAMPHLKTVTGRRSRQLCQFPQICWARRSKYGETTRLTKGQVTEINATVTVEYDSGDARFVDQIVIRSSLRFIGAGDSGSLLVTRPDANPVGLLFAGNKSGRVAIANPIALVLGAFE